MNVKTQSALGALKERVLGRRPAEDILATGNALRFVACMPEPLSFGSPHRGRLLIQGRLHIAGEEHAIPDGNLWKLENLPGWAGEEILGFSWLDDLAAVRSPEAIGLAKTWVFDWITHSSIERNRAWRPEIAARRVMRLRHNEYILLAMAGPALENQYFASLATHAKILRNRLGDTPMGVARIETLAGRVYAELARNGDRKAAIDALRQIADAADMIIEQGLGIESRNPQELLIITESLQWCASLASLCGIAIEESFRNPIQKAVHILRILRHADGSLARFHGAANPLPGRLDRALTASGHVRAPQRGLAMGFARLSAGRTTLISDVAPPQSGKHSRLAHAGTLAFELTEDSEPIVVNGGPGWLFGENWHTRARQTGLHSTVEVDNTSSSRMSAPVLPTADRQEFILVCPDRVRVEQAPEISDNTVIVSHNGYVPLFGLIHMRRIDMSTDGGRIWAEDTLWAENGENRRAFESVLSVRNGFLPFTVRFHLHPDIHPRVASDNRQVHIETSRHAWLFEYDGEADLALETSQYFDEHQQQVRQNQQITLHARITRGRAAQLRWSFQRQDKQV